MQKGKKKKKKNTQISRHQCKDPVWKKEKTPKKIKVTNAFQSFMKKLKIVLKTRVK